MCVLFCFVIFHLWVNADVMTRHIESFQMKSLVWDCILYWLPRKCHWSVCQGIWFMFRSLVSTQTRRVLKFPSLEKTSSVEQRWVLLNAWIWIEFCRSFSRRTLCDFKLLWGVPFSKCCDVWRSRCLFHPGDWTLCPEDGSSMLDVQCLCALILQHTGQQLWGKVGEEEVVCKERGYQPALFDFLCVLSCACLLAGHRARRCGHLLTRCWTPSLTRSAARVLPPPTPAPLSPPDPVRRTWGGTHRTARGKGCVGVLGGWSTPATALLPSPHHRVWALTATPCLLP